MIERRSDERGAAMVLAMGVLAVLAVLAMVVMAVVMTEKRTSFAEYANDRSFYSADAAGEAGLAWIRRQSSPPALVDTLSHVAVATSYSTLSSDHLYRFDVRFVAQRFRPGWSVDYTDYEYMVEAKGASVQSSESAVDMGAMRVYREGYKHAIRTPCLWPPLPGGRPSRPRGPGPGRV